MNYCSRTRNTFFNITDSDTVWTPKLPLQTTATPSSSQTSFARTLKIDNTGTATLWTLEQFLIPCTLDLSKFPFDTQVCPFVFESFEYSKEFIALYTAGSRVSSKLLQENAEWDVLSGDMEQSHYAGDVNTFDYITVTVTIKRKPLYHLLYSALPVAFTSILTIMCFVLPSESGERISLSVSLFLALAVLMTLVNSSLPETSEQVAVFGLYTALQMFWSGFTVVMSVVSVSIYYRVKTLPRNRVSLLVKMLLAFARIGDTEKNKADGHTHTKINTIVPALNESEMDPKPTKWIQNQRNGSTTNEMDPEPTKCEPNTHGRRQSECAEEMIDSSMWKIASIGLDRIWLIIAVIWHLVLNLATIGYWLH